MLGTCMVPCTLRLSVSVDVYTIYYMYTVQVRPLAPLVASGHDL
jgi:hypothetical protein